MVLGDDGPIVRQLFDLASPCIDLRFGGEDHAGALWLERAGLAVVQDLRLLVKFATDTVTAELAYDAVPVFFGVHLDCVADVANGGTRSHLGDAEPHTVIRD